MLHVFFTLLVWTLDFWHSICSLTLKMWLNSASHFCCIAGCSTVFLLHFGKKLGMTCCIPLPSCFALRCLKFLQNSSKVQILEVAGTRLSILLRSCHKLKLVNLTSINDPVQFLLFIEVLFGICSWVLFLLETLQVLSYFT